MGTTRPAPSNEKSSGFLRNHGWDGMLGTIAAFYVIMVRYTKVEESFNVQARFQTLDFGNAGYALPPSNAGKVLGRWTKRPEIEFRVHQDLEGYTR